MQYNNLYKKDNLRKIKMKVKKTITVFVLVFLASFSMAQEKNEGNYYINNSDRKWLLEIPLWIPGFRGDFVFGDVSLSSSNEKERKEKKRITNDLALEFFFVGRATVSLNKFRGHIDAFSSAVTTIVSYDRILSTSQPELVRLSLKVLVSRINLGYSIWSKTNKRDLKLELIPYLGLRYYRVGLDGSIMDSVYSGRTTAYWNDPLIGLYIPFSYKRFLFNAQWDISFDNSKMSWMLITQVQYRISKLIDVKMGWSQLRMRYGTIINDTNLELDIRLAGPTAGIGFRF